MILSHSQKVNSCEIRPILPLNYKHKTEIFSLVYVMDMFFQPVFCEIKIQYDTIMSVYDSLLCPFGKQSPKFINLWHGILSSQL